MNPRRLVLLVQLPIPPPGLQPVRGNVPLAAAYLKLFARRRGLEHHFRIELLPVRLANTLGDQGLVEELLDRRPWMIGFTCYLWNVQRTLWIVQRLKQRRPDLKVVLGGPEITPDNAWVLDCPGIDYAVFGEGEQTFAALLQGLRRRAAPPAGIAGLWVENSRPHCTAAQGKLAELDAVSSPYLEGILDAADERLMLLETVRGCLFNCRYCYYPKGRDTLRLLSAEQIAASLRHVNRRAIPEVFLLDPTLNQRPDFLDFLRALARANRRRKFTFSAELRAEGIDAATAGLLRQANFKELEIGLQSTDPRAQELMGRKTDLRALEAGAKALMDQGLEVRLDLILGLPGDTADSIRRGFDYLLRARPFSSLQVFQLSVLPGTAFRREAARLGLEFQPRPPYYALRTPTLDVEQMRLLMGEAQDALGVEFDAFPDPQFGPLEPAGGPIAGCCIDLDAPGAPALPPPGRRAQAFMLWLRAADFRQHVRTAEELIGRLLADNPHTTLQVVLEPTGDLHRLRAATLETLLAACHADNSYLDWYYSLQPAGLLGAKRLIVAAPRNRRARVGEVWIEEMGQCATLVWWGEGGGEERLVAHEHQLAHLPQLMAPASMDRSLSRRSARPTTDKSARRSCS